MSKIPRAVFRINISTLKEQRINEILSLTVKFHILKNFVISPTNIFEEASSGAGTSCRQNISRTISNKMDNSDKDGDRDKL